MFGRGRASKDGRTGGQTGTPPKPSRFALLLAAILFLIAVLLPQIEFLKILELKIQDRALLFRGTRHVSDDIAVIEIEEGTLEDYDSLGVDWPFPRTEYAQLLFALESWGVKAVGIDLWFSGPDRNDPVDPSGPDNDEMLAFVTGQLETPFHAIYFPLTEPARNPRLPSERRAAFGGPLEARIFPPVPDDLPLMRTFKGHIDLPDTLLAELSILGHIGLVSGEDGIIREIPMLVDHDGYAVPALSLLMAGNYLDFDWREARFEEGGIFGWRYLVWGEGSGQRIPVNDLGRATINFPGRESIFRDKIFLFTNVMKSVSFWLEQEEIPETLPQPEDFDGKVLLLCNTAFSTGIADFGPTPFSPVFPLPYAHLSMVNAIMEGDFLRPAPAWTVILGLAIIALVLAFVLPTLSPVVLSVVAAGSLVFVTLVDWASLFFGGIQIPLVQPYFLISHLSVGILVQGYLVKDRLRRAAEQELSIAHKIQQDLLPKDPLEAGNVRVWGTNLPCFAIGGDYFDYFNIDDGRVAVAVGDVSGKGVPAALLMSNIQAILRSECSRGGKVTEILENANNLLIHSIAGSNKFITFFLAYLDSRTNQVRYSNAGHNPPLVVRADGTLEKLEVGGLLLGIFGMATYDEGEVTLNPGDVLIMFTDGVTEAEDRAKNQYGDEPFEEYVVGLRHLSAQEIGENIREEILEFSKGIHPVDDLTVVVVKIEGSAEAAPAAPELAVATTESS
jgi:serine phosphatase RsbU (regulator of sigma subunit)/CHASE2 domain-containing sensor protein